MEDKYISWLNHRWLIYYVELMNIYKPTDKSDPKYEERIRIWQNMLSISSKLRDEIKKVHVAKVTNELGRFLKNGT